MVGNKIIYTDSAYNSAKHPKQSIHIVIIFLHGAPCNSLCMYLLPAAAWLHPVMPRGVGSWDQRL